MLTLLLKPQNIIIVAVLLGLSFAYFKGSSDTRNSIERKVLEETVENIKVRDENEYNAKKLSDYELCLRISRLREDCKRLLRSEPAADTE